MTEEWRDIEGYEGLYQVSNLGRVRRLARQIEDVSKGRVRVRTFNGHIMNPMINNFTGYVSVVLSKNGRKRRHYIHVLVANAFIQNPNNLLQVNHRDENKENNQADNLEWCTSVYNANYGNRNYKASLTKISLDKNIIVSIYKDYMSGIKLCDIVRKYNISQAQANGICHRRGIYDKILLEKGL